MANEFAHQMATEALNDFDKINTHHNATLSLADIRQYELLGPEQKRVGQFLEHNYDVIQNSDSSHDEGGGIDRGDLEFINLLSSGDEGAINNRKNIESIAYGVEGATAAAVTAAIPSVLAGMGTALIAPPAAPFVGWGLEGAATVGGYVAIANGVSDYYAQKQRAIGKMIP